MLETSSKADDSSIGFDGKNWYSNEQLTDFNETWFQARFHVRRFFGDAFGFAENQEFCWMKMTVKTNNTDKVLNESFSEEATGAAEAATDAVDIAVKGRNIIKANIWSKPHYTQ